MNDNELLSALLSAGGNEEEGQPDKRSVELRDGDSGDIGEAKDARADGFNTDEKYHDGRVDAHPNAQDAQNLVQGVMDDGGYVEPTGQSGHYGRNISKFRDKHGRDIAHDMVASGAAMPTSDPESMQAHMTGISRRALGYGGSTNEEMNAVGDKIRASADDFTPWENGDFQFDVKDRRSLFERAFDRGTDETKAALGGALNYIGEALGNEEWQKEGELIAFNHGISARANKRRFESYEKVEGFEQALDFVVETLGEAAPGLIVDAIATAGTVAAGAATGGSGAVVGASAMAAMRATAGRALLKGAKAGLYAGPALSGFAQSAGSMENRLDESGNEDHSDATLGAGLVGAAANALPFLAVLGRSMKASGVSDAALKPVMDTFAKPSVMKRLKDVGITTQVGALAEGSTEVAQTVINEIIATEMGGDDWSLETKDAVESGIRAVIGGGVIGGAASATGNTIGFMREYNKAAQDADAEGQKIDAEGWKADEEVEEEQLFRANGDEYEPVQLGEGIDKSIDRAARATFSKKSKAGTPKTFKETDSMEVAGQGQFDAMTAKDVPNLPSARYNELKAKLEPNGKPVDIGTVGKLIDQGELTNEELASYAADSHYGRKTPVSGGYDSAKGEEALRFTFNRVIDLSREGRIKMTDAQRDKLQAAEDEGTDTAIRNALASVSPRLTDIVYRHANSFDGRAMFRDYAKIKSDRFKTQERMKREADPKPQPEKVKQEPTVPEGDAPVQKPKPVRDDAPNWMKEGREPTKEELAEGMASLQKADKALGLTVKTIIAKEGKKSPKAKAVFQAAVAKDRKALAPIAKQYEFEGVGNFEADRRALVAKISNTQHTPDGKPNIEDKEGVKSLAKQVLGEKPKKSKRPTTMDGKLDYIKSQLGTRNGSDGQVGQLIKGREDYEKAKTRKDLFNPADLSAAHKQAIANKAMYEKQGNKAVVKAIEDLEDKIYHYELLKSYPKAVDQLFNEVENEAISRERGFKDDLRHEGVEVDENGSERSIGDTQSTTDAPPSNREIAANYTKRTEQLEHAFHSLRRIKGIDGKKLADFARELVKPNEVELSTGIKLKRGRATNSKAEKLKGQEYGLGLTGGIAGADAPKKAFTQGTEEKQDGVRHLNARTVKRIRDLFDEGDHDKIQEYLTSINVLKPDFVGDFGVDLSPEDRLHRIVKSSFGNMKRVREVTPKNRSTKGLVVRDNDSGKRYMVDMDAVTRWALRENDTDFDGQNAGDEFIAELGSSVLSGISALQSLKLDDGVSPAYSFDVNTIGDDVVVYRMAGDKRASVTLGSVRSSIYQKGRKRKASKSKGDPKLTDVADGDLGNVYRDDLTLSEYKDYVEEALQNGKLTEEQADGLLAEAEFSAFDREFEQAAKDGGELTIRETRVEDEFANREDFGLGSRDALHKVNKEKAAQKKRVSAAFDKDVAAAERALEELKAHDPSRAATKKATFVNEAKARLSDAKKAMSKALVGQIRQGDIAGLSKNEANAKLVKLHKLRTAGKGSKKVSPEERETMTQLKQREVVIDGYGELELRAIVENGGEKGFTTTEMRNAMGDLDNAPHDLLMAVARADKKRSNVLFDSKPDVYQELKASKHQLERAKKIEANVGEDSARIKAAKEAHAAKIEAAERDLEALKKAQKGILKQAEGTDMSKGRKIQLERKVVKVMKRRRGAVREPFYRLLEMTKTRLKRIHPEAAARSDDYTAIRRNDTEYFASRIGKDIGDSAFIQQGYEDSINGVKSDASKKYEAFLANLSQHVRKSDPNFEPVIAKVHLDLHKVERNREGFLSILREGKVKNPEQMLESILEGNGYPEFAIRPELTSPPRGGRRVLDSMYEQLKAGGFADTDAPRHLIRLVNASMSWAAWNATHGGKVNGKWDSNAEFKRMESEVHPTNRQSYTKLYQGVTGRLGINMSPRMRTFNSAMLALQSATVLMFSGIASIPEVAAVYARMRGETDGMLGDARAIMSMSGRREMVRVARDFDIITDDVIEHSLQEMYNMNDMTMGRVSQKIQATMFKYNGQNYVTKMTRALATKAAERYLVRAVEDGDNVKLAELGVEAHHVLQFNKNRDLDSIAGRKYRDAVHKFVNEAVTNPRSTQLPLIANDPRFLLVTTLKKFFYGFYDNVHKGLVKDFNTKRANGENPLKTIAITAAVALPMALMAEVIREHIKYPLGRPEWQGERDIADWVGSTLMATGGAGPVAIAESVYRGTSYGNHPLVAAAGPIAQLAVDVAMLEANPSRFVPVANQHPFFRELVDDNVKNLIK
ncbi:hypothetical protein [Pseudoalteromonas sp. CH_XMU1449-3]|uniref:hypothetical protein n=1 Tax=Pseudoalteromonas sp. CH_XMU1449-3 TaxID=3107774 RepID=UPI00300B2462